MNHPLQRLGRAAARELALHVARSDLAARNEARVLASAPRRRGRVARMAPLFAFAAAALVIVATVARRPPSELTFTIAGEGTGTSRSPIVTQETPKLIAFSEGTTVNVAAHGEVRVLRTDRRGAEVGLLGGTLTARVKHVDTDARWLFRAGPYTVRVTGTAFDLSWDEATRRLNLQMHEGRVLVEGGGLAAPREVRTGETFRVGPAESPAPQVDMTEVSPPEAPQPARAVVVAEANAANAAGKLFARADGIRLAGDEREAVRLFESLSQKYPRDALAGLASFAAGRLLLLQLHEPRRALYALERARRLGLPEPLGEECHARIVQALTETRRRELCVKEKARYLGKYRHGVHVAMVADACD